MKYKKLIIAALAAAISVNAAGCGSSKSAASEPAAETTVETTAESAAETTAETTTDVAAETTADAGTEAAPEASGETTAEAADQSEAEKESESSAEDASETSEEASAEGTSDSAAEAEAKTEAGAEVKAAEETTAESASEASTGAAAESTAETAAEITTESAEAAGAAAEAVSGSGKSAADIFSAITGSVALNDIMQMPAQYIMNYYGIDTSAYPDSFFAMSQDATSAETVIFVRTSDAGSAAAVQSALQAVLDQKAAEMKDYLPEQYQIVSKSRVATNGNAVYLIISEQEAAIRSIIEAGL